ncbi:MAG: FtsX-like permease family protein [Clostridiales bacterium]|nr:FtsX-like permease family protein [Clostridiales bacterium]
MEYRLLVRAGVKKQKGVLMGIFLLLFLVSLSFGSILTVWRNSGNYVREEISRAGYGTITAWVSGLDDASLLIGQMEEMDAVGRTEVQQLIFSDYTILGEESDSEGQLILWEREAERYRFFTDDLSGYQAAPEQIEPETVYVSPSLVSLFGVGIGDTVSFAIARNGGTVTLTVAGFYEDPFMGSSMIGMKGFLISEEDYEDMTVRIQDVGINALARNGSMIHIFQSDESMETVAELNTALNEQTDLSRYTEFVHSAETIAGFMLILQNAFAAMLAAFVLVLLVIVLIVLSYSVSSTVETERKNTGILKSVGFSEHALQRVQLMQYGTAVLPALLLGFLFAAPAARFLMRMTLTTTGILIPTNQPWGLSVLAFLLLLAFLSASVWQKTKQIGKISPMEAIREGEASEAAQGGHWPAIKGGNLAFSIAVRQLFTGKKKYVSACMVALLLTFFASLIGRMDSWLGPDGKGMMDAFNPADHDIGVQMFGISTEEEALAVINQYTEITDTYDLAMPGVSVNGIDYTANVITDPERFHILEGRACTGDDEIVLTEFVATDLGVSIGDMVTVTGGLGQAESVVSGIYSCANDMGDNVGMSREGYLKIGADSPQIWCHHYFLADTSQKEAVTEALTAAFGGDVHVHENTWSGLNGMIAAMRLLVIFMYGIVALFILIVTVMTGTRLLGFEQRDIGIYKSLGFSNRLLRLSFAIRFALTAVIGSVTGSVLAAVLTDPLVSAVMKLAGISNFASSPSIVQILIPGLVVTLLFFLFAYAAAGKIKKTDLTVLISE